jgi:hypothetical protein
MLSRDAERDEPHTRLIVGQTFRTNNSKTHCFFSSVRELSVISNYDEREILRFACAG